LVETLKRLNITIGRLSHQPGIFVERQFRVLIHFMTVSLYWNIQISFLYLTQRLSQQIITYDFEKKRKYFQKDRKSPIFRKKQRFVWWFFFILATEYAGNTEK